MSDSEQISIPLANGRLSEALLYRPEGDEPNPAVLVLHDVLGVTNDLHRISQRFAAAGYVALAPDLFGPGRKPLCIVKTMRALAAKEGHPFEVMRQAQRWLGNQPEVDESKIGAVGFCLGGGFAVLHAAESDLAFVGAFYGETPKELDDLKDLPPCFAGYGKQDLMFRGHGQRLKANLAELKIANDVRLYDDVGHSYMNQLGGLFGKAAAFTPMRARYDETAAEDSWAGMLQFFEHHLNNAAE